MKKGPVITDPHKKWYEKSGHLIGKVYFLHAYGPIYVLSAEVVASLAAARNNRSVIYMELVSIDLLCSSSIYPVAADINSGEVARRMEGYSGDDLTNVYRDASLNGTRRKIASKERDETKNV
ncbi:hypothetical protein NC652_039455 [Populus alba x Populus x berolinensis]|nr:hypothetical protein NC652_039455 [Populus alba x Populus x berolinensis]